jgi:hypothetical protein
LEIHFGKPVIAKVKKCRLVIVRKKLPQEDEPANGSDR